MNKTSLLKLKLKRRRKNVPWHTLMIAIISVRWWEKPSKANNTVETLDIYTSNFCNLSLFFWTIHIRQPKFKGMISRLQWQIDLYCNLANEQFKWYDKKLNVFLEIFGERIKNLKFLQTLLYFRNFSKTLTYCEISSRVTKH